MENGNAGFTDPSTFHTDGSDLFADFSAYGLNGVAAAGGVGNGATGGVVGGPPQQGNRFGPSTQMVRRNANQQVVQQQAPGFLQPWQDLGDAMGAGGGAPGAPGTTAWDNSDEEENLEAKALAAKKDAQAKRKQIPPFVQKLSSFLDESRNTELIRWADDGNSFIVVDEDEFAKTLIPELFKHNNYASFVRQLNMYGFHKKVGLTDNSMRASEQKKKLPSVYYNKYFKRGRPELLWLIQKPKSSSSTNKRKRDDKNKMDGDSDDEAGMPGMDLQGTARPGDGAGGSQNNQLIMHHSSEISRIRQELQMMQRQQKYILSVIQQLKRQNDQFYQQASAYQQLHDRHENSINAILTFLATFYNRTLDKNGPDIADIFSHAISGKANPQHSSVVDVSEGDIPDVKANPTTQFQRRKPLALLPAPIIAESTSPTPGTAATIASSVRSTASPAPPNPGQNQNLQVQTNQLGNNQTTPGQYSARGANSPLIKTDAETPNVLNQLPENDELMSVIQAANSNPAFDSSSLDFSSALSQLQSANNQTPLTPQERDSMLAMLANNGGNNGTPLTGGTNNALISPDPPSFPPLDDIASARNHINMLEKLQDEQARRVSELANQLQPLSPNGTIPGLADDGYPFNANSIGNPGEWDLNSFIQPDDYFPNTAGDPVNAPDTALPNGDIDFGDVDFNFGYDDADKADTSAGNNDDIFGDDFGSLPHGKVESVSSAATSPATTVRGEDGDRDGSASKKRRVG